MQSLAIVQKLKKITWLPNKRLEPFPNLVVLVDRLWKSISKESCTEPVLAHQRRCSLDEGFFLVFYGMLFSVLIRSTNLD